MRETRLPSSGGGKRGKEWGGKIEGEGENGGKGDGWVEE